MLKMKASFDLDLSEVAEDKLMKLIEFIKTTITSQKKVVNSQVQCDLLQEMF